MPGWGETNRTLRSEARVRLRRRSERAGRGMSVSWIRTVALACLLFPATSVQAEFDEALHAKLEVIDRMAEGPDDQIDLLAAKFAIDRLVSPAFDEPLARRRLDALHAAVVARIPAGASNDRKLELLMDTVYKPGPWNDHHPFVYDFDDPFGRKTSNKLLSSYLQTRKGNCVTMPTLLVVLGHR